MIFESEGELHHNLRYYPQVFVNVYKCNGRMAYGRAWPDRRTAKRNQDVGLVYRIIIKKEK